MQHQVLHLHPWLLLLLQRFLGFHVPGHRQLQPWEVSPEFLLNWCHPLGCLALRHPSCIPSLPTRGGGRGVRTPGTRAWGSRGIRPGTHRNVRFLLENSNLGRDCWLLFDAPLQRKHCWWVLSAHCAHHLWESDCKSIFNLCAPRALIHLQLQTENPQRPCQPFLTSLSISRTLLRGELARVCCGMEPETLGNAWEEAQCYLSYFSRAPPLQKLQGKTTTYTHFPIFV